MNHVGLAIHRIRDEEIAGTLEVFDEILRTAEPQDLMAAHVRGELRAATERGDD